MRIVDLFSGCGGMSKGFQNAGFDIVGAFDSWELAVKCYMKNFNHPVFCTNLDDVKLAVKQIKELQPNIIIGGPPCQDFSHAGKREENERASLTVAFSNIIQKIRPQYFVMENVDRITKSKAYQTARESFKKSGYGLTEIILDASLCGAPQKRRRFFCIGSIGENDEFMLNILKENFSKKHMTLRDFFGSTLGFEYYYRHPRNYDRRGVFSIDEPSPTIRGVNRPIPKNYKTHHNDACPIETVGLRALTTDERALIQTFPQNYHWIGNKTEMEQMIGNAVPVKLAEYVGKSLKKYIRGVSELNLELDEKFNCWLSEKKGYTVRSRKDVISRIRRALKIKSADKIDELYIFQLERIDEYAALGTGIRSQIKRALKFYIEYKTNLNIMEEMPRELNC